MILGLNTRIPYSIAVQMVDLLVIAISHRSPRPPRLTASIYNASTTPGLRLGRLLRCYSDHVPFPLWTRISSVMASCSVFVAVMRISPFFRVALLLLRWHFSIAKSAGISALAPSSAARNHSPSSRAATVHPLPHRAELLQIVSEAYRTHFHARPILSPLHLPQRPVLYSYTVVVLQTRLSSVLVQLACVPRSQREHNSPFSPRRLDMFALGARGKI